MKFRYSLLLVVALVTMVGMNSCVRTYKCQCNVIYTGQPGLPDTSFYQYDIKNTKSKAKSLCESTSSTDSANLIRTNEPCFLY